MLNILKNSKLGNKYNTIHKFSEIHDTINNDFKNEECQYRGINSNKE